MALIQLNINRWGQGWCVLFQCGAGRFITTAGIYQRQPGWRSMPSPRTNKRTHTGGQDRHCVSVSACLSCHMLAPRVGYTLHRDTETPRDRETWRWHPGEIGSELVRTWHLLLKAK